MGKNATFVTIMTMGSRGLSADCVSGQGAPAGVTAAKRDGLQANGALDAALSLRRRIQPVLKINLFFYRPERRYWPHLHEITLHCPSPRKTLRIPGFFHRLPDFLTVRLIICHWPRLYGATLTPPQSGGQGKNRRSSRALSSRWWPRLGGQPGARMTGLPFHMASVSARLKISGGN